MRYADRDGNIYEEENGQDRLLHWMYTTMAGRASLKILIRPWVSKLGGAFLSSPISKCLIKGFVKNNHIDMSEYEKKNYKSYNEFFSRKIKEGKRPFPEDKTILGSPCDCKVSVYPIEEKTSFVVKDTRYTLDSLIRNRKIARHFQGGYAVILRLTVDDYHRYCYFDDGIKSENLTVADITVSEEQAKQLAEQCTRNQVSDAHLLDIIEDWFGAPVREGNL